MFRFFFSLFLGISPTLLGAAGGSPLTRAPRQYFLLFPNVTIKGVTFAVKMMEPDTKNAIARKLGRLMTGKGNNPTTERIQDALDNVQNMLLVDDEGELQLVELIKELQEARLQTQEAVFIDVSVPESALLKRPIDEPTKQPIE